jgi:hypothetical protein
LLLLSLGIVVGGVCDSLLKGRTSDAYRLAGTGSLLFGLPVWILLAYWRGSLCIKDGRITQRGILRIKTIESSELVDLRWQPSKTILLRSKAEKIKVDLSGFDVEQQKRLIRFFRFSVPDSIQHDWQRFCYQNDVYLLMRSSDRPLREYEVLITRCRYDRCFLPIIVLAAVAGIVGAWQFGNLAWLLTFVPLTALWLFLRTITPVNGMVDIRVPISFRQPEGRYFLTVLIWAAVGMAGMVLLAAFSHHLAYLSLWLLLWLSVPLILAYWLEPRSRRSKYRQNIEDRHKRIDIAVKEWEQQEEK